MTAKRLLSRLPDLETVVFDHVYGEVRMKWIPRFAAIVSTVAILAVAVASAQTASLPVGKNGDVEFTEAVTVGTTVLQPAHYRFKHTMQGGQHYLLISRQQTATPGPSGSGTTLHYGAGKGTEVARIPCQLVHVDGTIKQTELHTRKQADGSQVLTQIRIAGEGTGHLLALEPQG
jgi:hypothetical protein